MGLPPHPPLGSIQFPRPSELSGVVDCGAARVEAAALGAGEHAPDGLDGHQGKNDRDRQQPNCCLGVGLDGGFDRLEGDHAAMLAGECEELSYSSSATTTEAHPSMCIGLSNCRCTPISWSPTHRQPKRAVVVATAMTNLVILACLKQQDQDAWSSRCADLLAGG